MNLKDLLDLSEKLEDRISAYWNFFTIVVLAVGGWLFTKPELTAFQKGLLIVVLLVFFASNLSVISYATIRLLRMEDEIKAITPAARIKSRSFRDQLLSLTIPRRLELSWILHGAIDLAVLAVIVWS